jgi:CRISPR-associated protein Cas2
MKKTPPRFLAIAYDVADDRRRRRVFKTLKNFGKPVQYSAFECVLDGEQLSRLRQLLTRQTDDDDDSVAYYQLCDDCARRTVVFCGPTRLTVPRVVVV